MRLHALSRACHHTDGMTRFKWVAGDVEEIILGIVRPQVRREVVPLRGVVVDEVLLDRVFSLPITTVKSILHSCRMAFSHALPAALGKVAATPTSIEAWVKLLLLLRCMLRVFRPSNRRERRSGNRKSLQCHSIQRALAVWGGDGFIELIPSLFAQPLRVVSGKDDRVSGSDSSTMGTNVKQCLRKVSNGHFTAAVKVLCSLGVAPFEPPLVVDIDNVLGCIQSFPKRTSCGRDGLRAQHILDALCGEGSAIVVGLLKAISVVVNFLLEERCPKRRLASKVAMRGVRKEMSKYVGDFQFGVGVPSGAEAVLHGANRFLNKFHSDGSLAMLTVDFSNAFNLVDRTTLLHEVQTRCPSISLWVDFLYGQSARLYVGDDHIWSTTRVQQGDPLGPLIFALVLHPLVHRIRDCCQLLFHAWYLDDGTIIGDANEAENGLFSRDIGRPTLDVKLLGGAVSRDARFISSLAVKKASRVVELMSLLPRLRGPHHAWASQSYCYCGLWGSFFGDFQWRLASLPIRFGGLGLCSAEDVSTYAFVVLRAQSWSLQDHILQGCGIDGADSDYGYALDRVRMSLPEFDLSVIPIEGLGQLMSDLEYRTILKYRLIIPLFPVDEPCPVCRKVCLDSFGEHAVHCKELPGFKYRHDLVRDVLYDVLKRAGISSKKEGPVNFLTDPLEGRSTLRPADILVFGWAEGKHACVDLTRVSPLVGIRDNEFVVGQVAKHEKTCLENQHVFIPFAFDTFDFLPPEAKEFFTRVQRVMQRSENKGRKNGNPWGTYRTSLTNAKNPSPSRAFIKENIDVLRTMIKEHDQKAKMKATPRKLAYADSDKEAPASKSQRTPSKNKKPTHLRRSRRLEDQSITKEKARRERSKSIRKRFGHQETSSDSEHEEGLEDAYEDLNSHYKRPKPTPFTQRITRFKYHRRAKLLRNIRACKGNKDLEDHLGIFSAVSEQEEWPMPICCKMFRQTLGGATRNWFDDMDPKSMDSFEELS
ncbi:putative reverse transcriptase domain-containing protein [Tanacetum coccineum]